MDRWIDRQTERQNPNILKAKVFVKANERINISYKKSQNKNCY